MLRRAVAATVAALGVGIAGAGTAQAVAPLSCPGDPIEVDRAITGEFDRSVQGSYVLVPFDVPAGTTSVRVKYCHDQPESPTSAQFRHTLDLGMYDPGFRGWGGSSHPDVTITPQGFSSEEQYKADPKGHVPGRTTRGFRPGPIPAGRWAAELGVAAVVSREEGDLDGKVAWRVEVDLSSDPAFAAQPYEPAPYDAGVDRGQGWYAGDLHVHAEHSSLGDATMTEVFEYAFGPAKLDFVMLSDYVTDTGWGEIGRHQPGYAGKLIGRSSEVITYRGHTNNHASGRYVDYRTGPVYERGEDGSLTQVRGARPPREIFDGVHAGGGWTQINHPTIFPSETPGFANLCRGCPWDYSDEETDWSKVDSLEVSTGPAGFTSPVGSTGPNPFTLTAIEEWDDLRRRGFPITAVGVSDSHHAGRANNPVTQTPVGDGHTVVFADELSETGVRRAVQAGHAYVKLFGADSPDLRFDARAPDGHTAMMGDALPSESAAFEARVSGAGEGSSLIVLRDGQPIQTVPVAGDDFTHRFTASQRGHYRLQVQRGSTIDALSNPISLGFEQRVAPAGPVSGRRPTLKLRSRAKRLRVGARKRMVFKVTSPRGARMSGVVVRFNGRRVLTDSRGFARITTRLRRPRVYLATATLRGYKTGKKRVRGLRVRR